MIVHFSDARWPQVEGTVNRLLSEVSAALRTQPLTSSWSQAEQARSFSLLAGVRQDWADHSIRVADLHELEALSSRLDTVAATLTRAHLEAIRGQVLSVLDDAATELEQGVGRSA
jgi:predicted glycoside hydrolase/deacetylase ChbG (UPF0249 family)